MSTRINRTKRKTIAKRDVEIRVRPTEGREAPIFDIQMDLSPYEFPGDARVRIEAARSNAVQRWDFGTVGDITEPREEERRLTEVPTGGTFRVCVVAGDSSGKLLGHAPRLRPILPLNSRLPLEEVDTLGQEVWRVEFEETEGNPVLQVNGSIPGISEIVRSDPSFRALVMPDVFRTILTRMTLIDRADADDDAGPWADWFAIARAYHPDSDPPSLPQTGPVDSTEIDRAREWIDAVVSALAEKPLDAAGSYAEAAGGGRT